jgi:hypothetical protein
MKIEAKSIRCTEIYAGGKSVGIFYRKSQWNGLTELRRVTDQQNLVIGTPEGDGFTQIFGDIFGGDDENKDTYLVNGSPDLINQIKTKIEKAATTSSA